ncbi:MAG TPA: cation diffusion facilitator family transporter [Pseudolabrys sp.]
MHNDHGHDHNHSHASAGHSHAPKSFGTAFAIGTALNFGLVAIQISYGIQAHSVALLADAGHNLADALGLLIAWGAHVLSASAPTRRYTYGLRAASILSALANGVILLIVTGAIAWEAVQRLFEPGPVSGLVVMVVAAAGIVINGLSAWLLMAGQRDLNIRGAFLHLLGDAAVSAGVLAAGAIILLTGWNWIDPLVSIVISVVIVWAAWRLLTEATNLSLNAVPSEINPDSVRQFLTQLRGVNDVHDLHIWAMSTTETALTGHLVMPEGHPGDGFLHETCEALHHKFQIAHTTLQIELDGHACKQAPEHVV